MNLRKHIIIGATLSQLLASQVMFAQTIDPSPIITIDPSVLNLTTIDPLLTTDPGTSTTGTTTDPNGTTATPPPVLTTGTTVSPPPLTTDPNGQTGTTTTDPGTSTTGTTTDPNGTPPTTGTTTTTGTNSQTSTTPPRSTSGTTTNTDTPRTNNIPTEEPEVGIIDISTSDTQEECPVQADTLQCQAPEEIVREATPILTANQIKFSLLVFLGGGLGALFWILTTYLMNNAHLRREEARFYREERALNENRRLDQLSKIHTHIAETIANLSKENGKRFLLTRDALHSYKKASIELEMFGSERTLQAHKNFMGMLHLGSPTKEEFTSAKNELITSLKKDLGL